MCSPVCNLVENIDIVKDEKMRLLKNRSKFRTRLQPSGFRHHYRNIYTKMGIFNAAKKGSHFYNLKNSVQEYKNM